MEDFVSLTEFRYIVGKKEKKWILVLVMVPESSQKQY